MPTTRKTAAKKTAKKTTKKASTTRSAVKTQSSRAGEGTKARRDKLALLDCLQNLGLLESSVSEKLTTRAESLAESKATETLGDASSFDRALTDSLTDFESEGGDGNLKSVYPALVAWQGHVSRLPETEAGLQTALTALRKVVPFAGASLYVRNPDRPRVESVATVGFEVELIQRIRFDEGSGFSAWVASRKKPILYSSLHRHEAPDPDRVRSFMSVPILVGDECIGVLNLGHTEENAYTQTTLRRLMLCGSILAAPVQRFVAGHQIAVREIRNPESGLATRHYLASRLDEEVVRCRELGHSMSLIVLQMNELDSYTAQFGEEYRQRCRQEAARLVEDWAEPTEIVGHGEGDRLIVLLPAARRPKAEARAGELIQLLEKHAFPRRKRMTVGLGLASYPGDAEESQELLSHADKDLGESRRDPGKRSGLFQTVAVT